MGKTKPNVHYLREPAPPKPAIICIIASIMDGGGEKS